MVDERGTRSNQEESIRTREQREPRCGGDTREGRWKARNRNNRKTLS